MLHRKVEVLKKNLIVHHRNASGNRLDGVVTERIVGDFQTRVQGKLFHSVVDMPPDDRNGDVESLPDLPVCQAATDKSNDIQFAFRHPKRRPQLRPSAFDSVLDDLRKERRRQLRQEDFLTF